MCRPGPLTAGRVGPRLRRGAPAGRRRAARAGPKDARPALDRPRAASHRRRSALGILPGLGQATGGDPLDGGKALLVNGGWEAGAAVLALDGLYVDATLLTIGVGLRYYIGNIHNGAAAWRAAARRTRDAAARDLARLVGDLPLVGEDAVR